LEKKVHHPEFQIFTKNWETVVLEVSFPTINLKSIQFENYLFLGEHPYAEIRTSQLRLRGLRGSPPPGCPLLPPRLQMEPMGSKSLVDFSFYGNSTFQKSNHLISNNHSIISITMYNHHNDLYMKQLHLFLKKIISPKKTYSTNFHFKFVFFCVFFFETPENPSDSLLKVISWSSLFNACEKGPRGN